MSKRRFPHLILIKRPNATGYGFTHPSDAEFEATADAFLKPIDAEITERLGKDTDRRQDMRLSAARSFLQQFFDGNPDPHINGDGLRWTAAGLVREFYAALGSYPPIVVIERRQTEIALRPGKEFLSRPGWPLAVIIGRVQEGGGTATFYDREADFRRDAKAKPTEDLWLPQVLDKLYSRMPAVMMGVPVRQEGGKMGIETRAVDFGQKGQLVDR